MVIGGSAGATAAFVAAFGYATRKDLSMCARPLLWAPLALIVCGIVGIRFGQGRQ